MIFSVWPSRLRYAMSSFAMARSGATSVPYASVWIGSIEGSTRRRHCAAHNRHARSARLTGRVELDSSQLEFAINEGSRRHVPGRVPAGPDPATVEFAVVAERGRPGIT